MCVGFHPLYLYQVFFCRAEVALMREELRYYGELRRWRKTEKLCEEFRAARVNCARKGRRELPNSAGGPDARLDVGPSRLVDEPLVLDLFCGASAK